jgi:hypothetical protein
MRRGQGDGKLWLRPVGISHEPRCRVEDGLAHLVSRGQRRLAAHISWAEADAALVAGEEDRQVRVLHLAVTSARHLALLAVHQLGATREGLALCRVEQDVAHFVAAHQHLHRCR